MDDSAKSVSSRENESSAFHMFRAMDRKGSVKAAFEDTTLSTTHQNTITYLSCLVVLTRFSMLRPYEGMPENVTKIASSGLDGRIVIWDVPT